MQFPCETIVREVLPAFKAFIVKKLFNDYEFSQSKIANILGITQASVSYYLHGERGHIGNELIKKYPKVHELLLSLTQSLVDGSHANNPDFIVEKICDLCYTMHDEFGCSLRDNKKKA